MSRSQPSFIIRPASPADAAALLEIYRPYVERTAITFEYEVPSVEEFAGRIKQTLKTYPYLVAESLAPANQGGKADAASSGRRLLGYCYASPFKERAAYQYAVETSIYVDLNCHHQGVGKALYEALENLLTLQGVINVNACIAYDATEGQDPFLTNASVDFHQHLGYQRCAHFQRCGYKFGRWYDMIWMEKMLDDHPAHPDPLIPFAWLLPALNSAYAAKHFRVVPERR